MCEVEDIVFCKSLLLCFIFNHYVVAFFETSISKEVFILHYVNNNSTKLLPKFFNFFDKWFLSFFFFEERVLTSSEP